MQAHVRLWIGKGDSLKFRSLLAVLAFAAPAGAQYAGPAILTRGEAPVAMSAPQIRFRPFLEVTGIYDSGLAGTTVTNQGGIADQASTGIAVAWGISGTHSWRHTKLGLDYRGSINHYAESSGFDSLDQSLMLGLTHQISRHVMFNLHTSAGIFTRDFGLNGLPQTVPFDPATTNIPTTDYFDNRTMYISGLADIVYQRTARLSFDFGGGGSVVRRRSNALDGTVEEKAHADMQYRLTRRVTVGANYNYFHYDYTHVFGGTDVHGATGSFGVAISRWMELTGYAGVSRVESKFIQVVPLDPVIVALLGVTSGTQVAHTISSVPTLGARLSRTFQRGVAYVSAGHSVVPGNGLFLTSFATTVFGGYTYTGLRRWSLGTEVSYSNSRSIGNIMGAYSNVSGNISASRQIFRSVHFVMAYSARQYNSPDFANYNKLVHEARIGLGWAPGEVPLRVW